MNGFLNYNNFSGFFSIILSSNEVLQQFWGQGCKIFQEFFKKENKLTARVHFQLKDDLSRNYFYLWKQTISKFKLIRAGREG